MSIRAVAYDLPENESRELLAHGVNPINIESRVVDLRHLSFWERLIILIHHISKIRTPRNYMTKTKT